MRYKVTVYLYWRKLCLSCTLKSGFAGAVSIVVSYAGLKSAHARTHAHQRRDVITLFWEVVHYAVGETTVKKMTVKEKGHQSVLARLGHAIYCQSQFLCSEPGFKIHTWKRDLDKPWNRTGSIEKFEGKHMKDLSPIFCKTLVICLETEEKERMVYSLEYKPESGAVYGANKSVIFPDSREKEVSNPIFFFDSFRLKTPIDQR